MDALARLSAATQALAEASTLDEIKSIIDIAEAAKTYARAAKLGLEAANNAAEIKLRAERKAGELLAQLERDKGGDRHSSTFQPGILSEYRAVLTESEIAPTTAHRWQTIATIPEETFEEHIATVKGEKKEITTHGVLKLKQKATRKKRVEEIAQANAPIDTLTQTYPIIYADPPWRYEHARTENRAIENHYPTMTLGEICDLPVAHISADDAVLFLWATSPKLAESMEVIAAWGFVYRTCMVWDKCRIGMGYYARQQHELLLIATRGSIPVPEPANRPASVVRIERDPEHSAKPTEFYEIIERMYPEYTKVELFARTRRPGWDAWGNQA